METETPLRKFTGTSNYVLDDELAKIVNISMALEMPLLLKGEPGTGKTMLLNKLLKSVDNAQKSLDEGNNGAAINQLTPMVGPLASGL